MQDISASLNLPFYTWGMQMGRPSNRPRTPFGQRVYTARQALGLSQAEVAEKLGLTQSGYAAWERDVVALRPEQLSKLAQALQISVEELLGQNQSKRGQGPSGKMRRLFEEVSLLPKSRQQRIAIVLEDMLAASRQP